MILILLFFLNYAYNAKKWCHSIKKRKLMTMYWCISPLSFNFQNLITREQWTFVRNSCVKDPLYRRVTYMYHFFSCTIHYVLMISVVSICIIPRFIQPHRKKPNVSISSSHLKLVGFTHYDSRYLIYNISDDDFCSFGFQIL